MVSGYRAMHVLQSVYLQDDQFVRAAGFDPPLRLFRCIVKCLQTSCSSSVRHLVLNTRFFGVQCLLQIPLPVSRNRFLITFTCQTDKMDAIYLPNCLKRMLNVRGSTGHLSWPFHVWEWNWPSKLCRCWHLWVHVRVLKQTGVVS